MCGVSYDEDAFIINGKRRFIYSGEIHYFRVSRGLWRDRLLKAKRAYLNCIASYIAWNWHEPREGQILLHGDRDIERYIKLCKELGLYFIARPGPYICSEWDSGGHPNWLYAKKCILRSLDPTYIRYSKKWYGVILPIIARNSISNNGSVIMVQIENEYFWGNPPYMFELYEIAKEFIKDLPIVTNENRFIRGTCIIDTLDAYPSPWDIEHFDRKIESYVREQPNKPKMFMELEGGWFSIFGMPLPTCRGSFPPGWTEILVKTAIGWGLNGINFYMFHGGTNPEYYTAKYITTTYDYEAAISEWGELRERYYVIKRIGSFIRFFEEELVNSIPDHEYVKCSDDNVRVFVRRYGKSLIIFLRNLTETDRDVKLETKDKLVIPTESLLTIRAKSMKIILAQWQLRNSIFKLDYSTSEPLAYVDYGNRKVLILYGDIDEKGELKVSSPYKIEVKQKTDGVKLVRRLNEDKVLVISYIHRKVDDFIELCSGSEILQIVFTSKSRASRTWELQVLGQPMLIISNIYFLYDYSYESHSLNVKVELDSDKVDTLTIITPRPTTKLRINDSDIKLTKLTEGIYQSESVTVKEKGKLSVTLKEFGYKIDDYNVTYSRITPYTPLEYLGYYSNGYVIYKIKFTPPTRLKNKYLYLSYFNDFASLLLNGEFLTSGYRRIEVIANKLNLGSKNELLVILESTGHNNDGILPILNGITGSIYISKVREIEPNEFKFYSIPDPYEILKTLPPIEMDRAKYLLRPNESQWFNEIIKRKSKNYKIVQAIKERGIYEFSIILSEDEKNYYWILEVDEPSEVVLVFVNDKHVGTCSFVDRGKLFSFEITKYLKVGENKVTVFTHGSCKSLRIKVFEYKVNGDWYLASGSRGLIEKWYSSRKEMWIELKKPKFPLKFDVKRGSIVWFKFKFTVDKSENIIAPLKLKLKTSCRCLIFVNGKLIGRYVTEGPQTDFYIPEDVINPRDNVVVLMLQDIGEGVVLENLEIEPYFIHKTVKISANLS